MWGTIRPMSLVSCDGRGSARDNSCSPALSTSARMSPPPGYPSAGCISAEPASVSPGLVVPPAERNHFHRILRLPGQAVLAVLLEDESLLSSLGDGQLICALGKVLTLHDFFTQLVVAES